jgi:hypothetical protein
MFVKKRVNVAQIFGDCARSPIADAMRRREILFVYP